MIRKAKQPKKKKYEEQLVQEFPHRCPYCDRPVSYDSSDLKVGENVIRCVSCRKTYIKVVTDYKSEGIEFEDVEPQG